MSVTAAGITAELPTGPDVAWKRALIVLALALAWAGYLYRDAADAMLVIWQRSETFNHCFLIPPIVAWLIWRKRAVLATMQPAPSFPAVFLTIGAGAAWLAGQLAIVNALTQFAFVAIAVASVPALLGFRVASAIAFPLAFLFFSVPFGEFVMPQMMELTADFTVLALRASGIPVYREGLQFVIPSGNWSVVEACSGVRYLIASFTVGTLFAYLNYRSPGKRLAFMLVSLAVPIVANWLRAYMIVMLGHISNNKLAAGVDHLIYGWVFFGVVIMIMFAIGSKWSEDTDSEPDAGSATRHQRGSFPARSAPFALMVAVELAALAAPPFLYQHLVRGEARGNVLMAPLGEVDGWRHSAGAVVDWTPAFVNPSTQVHATFRSNEQVVGVYIAYYRAQSAERKLVSSDNVLVKSTDPAWAAIDMGNQSAGLAGRTVEFKTADLRNTAAGGANRWLVWRTYWVDGRYTSGDASAKLLSGWSRLRGNGDDSALVVFYTPKGKSNPGGVLDAFAKSAGPAIDALLRQTREGR